MDPTALKIFVACIGALALNLGFLTIKTITTRTKAKHFVNPEDAKAFDGQHAPAEDPGIAKVKRAHYNAIESLVPFAILGWLYVQTGGSATGAAAYFITFTVARWLHSFFYLGGLQPFRTLIFVVAFLCNMGLAVQLLINAATG